MRKTFLSLMILLQPAAALAGRPEANACASALPAEARFIFAAVAPLVAEGSDMPAILRKETIALVKAARVARATAPDSATAASLCLKRLNP
jgi:hypothetical protein